VKISVITVCLNSCETIEKTIESVIGQSYHEKEYIIIDGGSTDGTVDIIKKYENDIAYWHSFKDDGIYDAMNQGIDEASGDIICFLNSNDWYEDEVFEKIIASFEEENCDVVSGRVAWIIENQVMGYSAKEVTKKDIYEKMIYQHPAMFVKSKLFEQYGKFDLTYKMAADYEWILRVYSEGANIKTIDRIITNFRRGGISYNKKCFEETREISLKYLPKELYDEYYDKIQDAYNLRMQLAGFRECVEIIQKNEEAKRGVLKILKRHFGLEKNCSLFGYGLRAWECKNVLRALGIKIDRVYDNSKKKQGEVFDEFVIANPEMISEDELIIITSLNYEKEICAQLSELGNSRYICLSKVIEIVIKQLGFDVIN